MLCGSVDLLRPLLTDEMEAHPAWTHWCKLVQLWTLVVQHTLQVWQPNMAG